MASIRRRTQAPPQRSHAAPADVPQRPGRNHVNRESPSVKTNPTTLSRLRVLKTYSPDQNGAKRFARRYGIDLVCVRHRLSDNGTVRHTTVELLVESTPIASRTNSLVAVRIAPDDKNTRTLLISCGAEWKPKERYWLLRRLVAKKLRLLHCVVPIST